MGKAVWVLCITVTLLSHETIGFSISAMQDPMITTAGNEHFHLDVPCRYELVNVVTNFKDTGKDFCHVRIYAYNARASGRFFVGGFDLMVTGYDESHTEFFHVNLKADGHATDGEYTYPMFTSKDGHTWDEVDSEQNNDPQYSFYLVKDKVKLDFKDCHFNIRFKAADSIEGPSEDHPSGMAVNIDNNQVHAWPIDKNLVGLPPKGEGVSASNVADMYNLDTGKAFTERVFHAHIHQNFHGASSKCAEIAMMIPMCDSKGLFTAFEMCTEILTNRHYVKCKSGPTTGTDAIMTHFSDCLSAFCYRDVRGLMKLNCDQC